MEAAIMAVVNQGAKRMKTILAGGALAALFLSSGCATDPYLKDSVTMGGSGQYGAPAIHWDEGKRKEVMVGSRLARESRESSESVKTISRRGYQEGRDEKPGSPMMGGG